MHIAIYSLSIVVDIYIPSITTGIICDGVHGDNSSEHSRPAPAYMYYIAANCCDGVDDWRTGSYGHKR